MTDKASTEFILGFIWFAFSVLTMPAAFAETANLQKNTATGAQSADYSEFQRQLDSANKEIYDLRRQLEEIEQTRISARIPYDVEELRRDVDRIKQEQDSSSKFIFIAIAFFIFLQLRESEWYKKFFASKKDNSNNVA